MISLQCSLISLFSKSDMVPSNNEIAPAVRTGRLSVGKPVMCPTSHTMPLNSLGPRCYRHKHHTEKNQDTKVSNSLFQQQLTVAEPGLFPGVCLQRRPYAWSLDHTFILIFKIVITKAFLICHSYVILCVWTNCSQ